LGPQALDRGRLGCRRAMDTAKLIEEVKRLRAATVEAMDELPVHDVPERERLAGRRDALDEVLILMGVPVGEP